MASVIFLNKGTFTQISSVQDKCVILKLNDLYSLDKAFVLIKELTLCMADFYLFELY